MDDILGIFTSLLAAITILEGALAEISVCKFCSKDRLSFYRTTYVNGPAKHYYIICNQCFAATLFYTLPKVVSPPGIDNTLVFGHNILHILGGR